MIWAAPMKRFFLPITLLALISLSGCASSNNDPFEGYNRAMYKTNKIIDQVTLKPLSKGYEAIVPDPAKRGVSNFFSNLKEVNTFANSLLQGKLHNAAASSARFVWNTTLGLGGLFDVATAMDIKADPEDLGQTLRTWGVSEGPYIVLPLLGPSTLTDSVGLVGDYYISPGYHYKWPNKTQQYSFTGLQAIDKRSKLNNLEKLLNNATVDEYSFVKESYLQRRAALVRDGKPDEKIDEAFDALFDEE